MPSLSKKSLLLRLSFWNFLLCDFPRLFRTGCHDLRGGRPGGVSAAPCGLRVSSESSQRAGGVACRAGQLFPVGLPEVRSHHRPETPHTPSCGIDHKARNCRAEDKINELQQVGQQKMVKGIVERQRVGWEVCGLTDVELELRGTLRASVVVFEQRISDSF